MRTPHASPLLRERAPSAIERKLGAWFARPANLRAWLISRRRNGF